MEMLKPHKPPAVEFGLSLDIRPPDTGNSPLPLWERGGTERSEVPGEGSLAVKLRA